MARLLAFFAFICLWIKVREGLTGSVVFTEASVCVHHETVVTSGALEGVILCVVAVVATLRAHYNVIGKMSLLWQVE